MVLSDDNLEKLREIFGNVSIQDLKDIQFEFKEESDEPGALERLEISQPHKAILIYRDKIESLQEQVAELKQRTVSEQAVEEYMDELQKWKGRCAELQEDRDRLLEAAVAVSRASCLVHLEAQRPTLQKLRLAIDKSGGKK